MRGLCGIRVRFIVSNHEWADESIVPNEFFLGAITLCFYARVYLLNTMLPRMKNVHSDVCTFHELKVTSFALGR